MVRGLFVHALHKYLQLRGKWVKSEEQRQVVVKGNGQAAVTQSNGLRPPHPVDDDTNLLLVGLALRSVMFVVVVPSDHL